MDPLQDLPDGEPAYRWELSHNDRKFLKSLRINPENPPYPSKEDVEENSDDGA